MKKSRRRHLKALKHHKKQQMLKSEKFATKAYFKNEDTNISGVLRILQKTGTISKLVVTSFQQLNPCPVDYIET